MKIYLAADHRGFELKNKLKTWLDQWGYEYEDMGAFVYDENDDYPDFIRKAAEAVANDPERSRGIILGGSGQGEAMVANRYKGVRAAVFYGPPFNLHKIGFWGNLTWKPVYEKIIKLSREHNDANVLSLGAFFLKESTVKRVVELWLKTPFPGEERHIRRIAKF